MIAYLSYSGSNYFLQWRPFSCHKFAPQKLLDRYVKPDPADMDVHLSSPVPAVVDQGYHKILKPVKESNRPHDLGGQWAATKVWER